MQQDYLYWVIFCLFSIVFKILGQMKCLWALNVKDCIHFAVGIKNWTLHLIYQASECKTYKNEQRKITLIFNNTFDNTSCIIPFYT